MKLALLVSGFVFVFILNLPCSSFAESQAKDILTKNTVTVGMAAGYWQGTTAIGHAQTSNRSAAVVMPRLGWIATDPIGSGWYQGNIEVGVEGFVGRFVKPFAADAVGMSFTAQYNFLNYGRWMPFWEMGAGMAWTNLAPRLPEQSTQFEFLLQTGPGVRYFLTDRLALATGVRFHHISNANLGERNTGLNATLPYIGLSLAFP